MRHLHLSLFLLLAACADKPAAAPTPVAAQPAPLKPVLVQAPPRAVTPATTMRPRSAANCAYQDEADALNMRVLQSDLMVGGLACHLNGDYADFVRSQKKPMAEHAAAMKRYFTRTGGGTTAMDRFVTGLANDSSKHSLSNREAAFCGQAKALFGELRALSSTQLAAKLNNTPDIVARRNVPLCASAVADVNRAGPQPTTPIGDALKR